MTCPVCRTPVRWEENPWRPFCSQRCQAVDFGRWASEAYRIPGEEPHETNCEHSSDPLAPKPRD
ncbi:MAG: DNA gyrase inhibitor YacG [Candidatus Binatia bacterium]|nr:DNA gyrase inhibitor YacG [Candidatus Binatia bacterium]